MREKGHWGGRSEGKEGRGFTGSLWASKANEARFGLLLSETGNRGVTTILLGKTSKGRGKVQEAHLGGHSPPPGDSDEVMTSGFDSG